MTRARFALALALVVGACGLEPIDVVGLRCDDEHPCGDGFECVDGRCAVEGTVVDAGFDAGLDASVDAGRDAGVDAGVDAGTDAGVDAGLPRGVNLLANPGFEQLTSDGGVASWRATTGRVLSSTTNHAGQRGARVQANVAAQQPALLPLVDAPGAELGMLFCGSLWVRGEDDAGTDVTLTIRDRFPDGGQASSSGTRVTVFRQWVQVKEEYASIGGSDVQLRLTSVTRLDAGEGFFVDDAWLSVAPTTLCP